MGILSKADSQPVSSGWIHLACFPALCGCDVELATLPEKELGLVR